MAKINNKVAPKNRGAIKKAEKEKKKIGRPTAGDEKADKKLSIYITASQLEEIELEAGEDSAAVYLKKYLARQGFIS